MLNEIMKKYQNEGQALGQDKLLDAAPGEINAGRTSGLLLSQDKLLDAPACGYILVYFQTGMEFGTYQKTTYIKDGTKSFDIKASCLEQEKYKEGAKLLELHLFDRKTEYRAVYTESMPKRGYLECIIKEGMSYTHLTGEELEGLDMEKTEFQLLYGSSYEYSMERGGILATQDGNKKFFYLPDPKGYDLYLRIINYFDYDGDMLVMKNYRLAGVYMRLEKTGRKFEYLWV